MDNWISVAERLPDRDGRYLVYRKGGYDISSFMYGIGFFGIAEHGITHWMPLPDKPKGV